MNRNNEKKNEQLGMPHGTAQGKLRKSILFSLLERYKENICYSCGRKIYTADELSIEHKTPWLDSEDPVKMFFDLDNIAFSHLECNVGARRQTRFREHGSDSMYKTGCRCEECRKAKARYRKYGKHPNGEETLC